MLEVGLLSDDEIRQTDNIHCSFGDTVHYSELPKVFRRCDGSFIFDSKNIPYLDIQMWYSACNLGYKNSRISNVLKQQMDLMPQLAPQFLHEYKILLAKKINEANTQRFGNNGRVQFNVGGSQAVEDALKLIRNYKKKNFMFAFMGGYHGRTLGASAITSSYRYRRRYSHFSDRAHYVPYPYCFRCFYYKKKDDCDFYCIKLNFQKLCL